MHAHRFPKMNDDFKTKEIERHKKNEQMEKINATSLLLLEVLEDDRTRNGVENVCYIHLKHNSITVEIQSRLNTMDHCFTSILNYHAKLM
jgi:transcriptional regulator of met regulon